MISGNQRLLMVVSYLEEEEDDLPNYSYIWGGHWRWCSG